MTRLIDADELIKDIHEFWDLETVDGITATTVLKQTITDIRNAPTVDAMPIRHGKWMLYYDIEQGRALRCSECKMVFWVGDGREGNFCPNCGARMDEE